MTARNDARAILMTASPSDRIVPAGGNQEGAAVIGFRHRSFRLREGFVPVLRAKPTAPSDDKRWRIVETRMRRLGNRPDALIEALHSAQEAFGFIDDDALRYVGESLSVPPSKVFGVATFYHHFTLKPQGEHTCVVCTGTACYINGATEILASIRTGLGVKPRETTADGKVSLLTARCLGACSLAPAVIVDGEVEGRVNARELVARLEAL
jgi:bidirectional [NiFe] hydrogenase diaphorase subunit